MIEQPDSFPGSDLLAGVLLVGVGFLYRYFMLGMTGLWLDEAFSLYYARQPLDWILEHAAGLINHPPLYFLLLKPWDGLFAPDQLLLEGLSVVFSLLAVLLFYLWVRRLWPRRSALGLAGLFAVHPFVLYYSVELRMYSLALAGLVGFGLLFTLLLEETSLIRWSGLALVVLISLYSHSLTFLYLLPGLVVLGWSMHSDGKAGEYWGFVGAAGLLYLPWLINVVRQALRISSDFWIPPFGPAEVVRLVYAWGGYMRPHGPGVSHVVFAVGVGLFLVVPVLFALKPGWTRERIWVASTVGFPFVVLAAVSLTGQSVFLLRGFLFGLPFLLVLWMTGLERLPSGSLRGVTIGLFFLFLSVNAVRLAQDPPHQFLNTIDERVRTGYPVETVLVHTSKRTFFPFQVHYNPSRTNRVLGDRLRYFFPDSWETTLERLKKTYPDRPVLFVVYEEEFPNWQILYDEIDSASRRRTRTIPGGEKTFHLLFVPDGLSTNPVSLASAEAGGT